MLAALIVFPARPALVLLVLLATANAHAAGNAAEGPVVVDFAACPTTRTTAAGVLVAADPEWLPSVAAARQGRRESMAMAEAAVAGVQQLAAAGGTHMRLLNFNIFPGISCAHLDEHQGAFDFGLMDEVMDRFASAARPPSNPAAPVVVDIETSPAYMWADANATNYQCANASTTTARLAANTRCPFFGDASRPRDPSWREIADYHASVFAHYVNGTHRAPMNITYWEVLNEVDHEREHLFSPESYVALYDVQVRAIQAQARASGLQPPKFLGPSLGGGGSIPMVEQWFGYILNASNHHPPLTPVDGITTHIYGLLSATDTPPPDPPWPAPHLPLYPDTEASCMGDPSAKGMEAIFSHTDAQRAGLERTDQLRRQLRPSAEIHLSESGIFCNQPVGCDVNNYTCWFSSFSDDFWLASAGQWLYQVVGGCKFHHQSLLLTLPVSLASPTPAPLPQQSFSPTRRQWS